jgi:hypothetical protein
MFSFLVVDDDGENGQDDGDDSDVVVQDEEADVLYQAEEADAVAQGEVHGGNDAGGKADVEAFEFRLR